MPKERAVAIIDKTGDQPGRMVTLQPETRADKFIRLANIRATAACEAIDRLGNLATTAYEYQDAQIAILENTISARLRVAIAMLRARQVRRMHHHNIL